MRLSTVLLLQYQSTIVEFIFFNDSLDKFVRRNNRFVGLDECVEILRPRRFRESIYFITHSLNYLVPTDICMFAISIYFLKPKKDCVQLSQED